MTLCIAGLSEWRRKITVVTDLKGTLGPYSADWITPKSEVVYRGYTVQYAGDDVERVPFIFRNARAILRAKKGKVTPSSVAFAVHTSYQEQLRLMIESQVLSRYGYTAASFQKYGKKQCTASVYNTLCNKIASVNLNLRFLIAGFDDDGHGHILVAGGEDPPTDYTKLGFFAIGSGANAALSSLLFNKHHRRMLPDISEAKCVYLLCEAKFMAEAGNVGDATWVLLMQPPGKGGFRFITEVSAIKRLWATEGAPRLPKSVEEKITPLLRSAEDIQKKHTTTKERD